MSDELPADYVARERIASHAHRLNEAEDHISDFRKMAAHIEHRIVQLEVPMRWIIKLLWCITLGTLWILGTMVANAIGMHIK